MLCYLNTRIFLYLSLSHTIHEILFWVHVIHDCHDFFTRTLHKIKYFWNTVSQQNIFWIFLFSIMDSQCIFSHRTMFLFITTLLLSAQSKWCKMSCFVHFPFPHNSGSRHLWDIDCSLDCVIVIVTRLCAKQWGVLVPGRGNRYFFSQEHPLKVSPNLLFNVCCWFFSWV